MGQCSASPAPGNSTLDDDAETLLALSRSFGRSERWLKNSAGDDVSRWHRWITVEEGRVREVDWSRQGLKMAIWSQEALSGTLGPEIGR